MKEKVVIHESGDWCCKWDQFCFDHPGNETRCEKKYYPGCHNCEFLIYLIRPITVDLEETFEIVKAIKTNS